MKTKIIAAFPGCGKTYFYNKNKDISIDSDSSEFSWIIDSSGNKLRNPKFPQNYISHIKENIGKYEFIFVSSHKEVRDALLSENIFFYLIYPDISRKDEFIERYKNRNNDENFIKLISTNWESWIKDLYIEQVGCKHINMSLPNLEDLINSKLI